MKGYITYLDTNTEFCNNLNTWASWLSDLQAEFGMQGMGTGEKIFYLNMKCICMDQTFCSCHS